jgi:hypothetical protein
MKRPAALLILGCLFFSHSVEAQHQTYLRGIVNVPGQQMAFLQIDRGFWAVHTGDHFEDKDRSNARFPIDVLAVDLTNEIVITRIAGDEYTNRLSTPNRPPTATGWIHMQDAEFKVMLDLYGYSSGRVILLHPDISRAAVSCEIVWTNQSPGKAEISNRLGRWFNKRNATAIEDGDAFLQIIPTSMVPTASLHAKDLAADSPAGENMGAGTIHFEGIGVSVVVDIYGKLLSRPCKENAGAGGNIPYFTTTRPLSKAQVMYAFETLLAWSGNKIVLNADGTFSVARTQ